MRLNKWLYLFWTTLLIGAVSALAVGLTFQIADKEFGFMGLSGIGFNVLTMVLGGLMFSIVSQMGFFAYLMVNYIAKSLFRNYQLWNAIQVVLIMGVLVVLPYMTNFLTAACLLVLAVIIAYIKIKMTHPRALIPTLFFLLFVTTVEAVPGLQQDNLASTLFMGVPLLSCNTWQILKLHQILQKKEPTEVNS